MNEQKNHEKKKHEAASRERYWVKKIANRFS